MKDIDLQIVALIEKVNVQKENVSKLEKASKKGWKTNGSLKIPGQDPVNLMTSTTNKIVEVIGLLLNHRNNIMKASELLGVEFVNEFMGYPYEYWIEDAEKRIATLELNAKKEKLNILAERLSVIESPEEKRKREIAGITKALG